MGETSLPAEPGWRAAESGMLLCKVPDYTAFHPGYAGFQSHMTEQSNAWPNNTNWSAERHDQIVETESGKRYTWVVDCGELTVPSGRLVACDPFVFLQPQDNPYVQVPAGVHPVTVTLADVSAALDRSHVREAYATIRFARGTDAFRKPLPLLRDGQDKPALEDGEFFGFGVDAGTACFIDDAVVKGCMPDPSTWYEGLFENSSHDCWFARMDDPAHIRMGIANIRLPLGKNNENIVIVHSGWGDGVYPVIGSYDDNGQLLAVHIDFFVIDD